MASLSSLLASLQRLRREACFFWIFSPRAKSNQPKPVNYKTGKRKNRDLVSFWSFAAIYVCPHNLKLLKRGVCGWDAVLLQHCTCLGTRWFPTKQALSKPRLIQSLITTILWFPAGYIVSMPLTWQNHAVAPQTRGVIFSIVMRMVHGQFIL